MRTSNAVSLFLTMVVVTAAPLPVGAGPAEDPAPQEADRSALTAPHQVRNPRLEEIKAAQAAGQELVVQLQLQLKAAPDEVEALRLLRAINQQKQDTEIVILRIQERYARQAGDTATADRIGQAVQEILNPPVPAPSAQARAESEARREGRGGHE